MWDASALVKRYFFEVGSDTVNELFRLIPASQMMVTVPGYAETIFALVRKSNRGEISRTALSSAVSNLNRETILEAQFGILNVDSDDVFDSIRLIRTQSINASDAAILIAYLRYCKGNPAGSTPLFVCSDHRLLRTAVSEGLSVLDPESAIPTDVQGILNSLAP